MQSSEASTTARRLRPTLSRAACGPVRTSRKTRANRVPPRPSRLSRFLQCDLPPNRLLGRGAQPGHRFGTPARLRLRVGLDPIGFRSTSASGTAGLVLVVCENLAAFRQNICGSPSSLAEPVVVTVVATTGPTRVKGGASAPSLVVGFEGVIFHDRVGDLGRTGGNAAKKKDSEAIPAGKSDWCLVGAAGVFQKCLVRGFAKNGGF